MSHKRKILQQKNRKLVVWQKKRQKNKVLICDQITRGHDEVTETFNYCLKSWEEGWLKRRRSGLQMMDSASSTSLPEIDQPSGVQVTWTASTQSQSHFLFSHSSSSGSHLCGTHSVDEGRDDPHLESEPGPFRLDSGLVSLDLRREAGPGSVVILWPCVWRCSLKVSDIIKDFLVFVWLQLSCLLMNLNSSSLLDYLSFCCEPGLSPTQRCSVSETPETIFRQRTRGGESVSDGKRPRSRSQFFSLKLSDRRSSTSCSVCLQTF